MKEMISQVTSRLSMHLLFDKVYTTWVKKPSLKSIVLLSDLKPENLEELVSSRKRLSRIYQVKVSPLERDFYRVFLAKKIRGRLFGGDMLIDSSHVGLWVVFTDKGWHFVTHVVEMFFNRLYPKVSRTYLNYLQIRKLLGMIKDVYRGQTTLTYFTIKREPRKLEKDVKTPKGTLKLWERDAEEELSKLRKDYRVLVDRLSFEVRDEIGNILLQAHITRKGLCRLKFGNFTSFYNNVILNMINLGLEWEKFYSQRERRIERGVIKLHPYSVKYPFDFEEEHLSRLAQELSKTYSCSVIYGGNPYFVANLCDYQDGSSFGLTILGNIVTVIPMLRATPYALWKLTNKLQELIGEGEILDIIR